MPLRRRSLEPFACFGGIGQGAPALGQQHAQIELRLRVTRFGWRPQFPQRETIIAGLEGRDTFRGAGSRAEHDDEQQPGNESTRARHDHIP